MSISLSFYTTGYLYFSSTLRLYFSSYSTCTVNRRVRYFQNAPCTQNPHAQWW
nr:MAG TPA: hypothetical protein [Caudoviricetes sp.]